MSYEYNGRKYIISDNCYEKIPDDYKSSWFKSVDKPTHYIEIREGSVYCIFEIDDSDSIEKGENKRGWFKLK